MTSDEEVLRCSFCGLTQKQVKKIIAGPGVYICDGCVMLCLEVLAPSESERAEVLERTASRPPLDAQIRKFLEERLERLGAAPFRIDTRFHPDSVRVDVHTTTPGRVIGRHGTTAADLRAVLAELTGLTTTLNVVQVPEAPNG